MDRGREGRVQFDVAHRASSGEAADTIEVTMVNSSFVCRWSSSVSPCVSCKQVHQKRLKISSRKFSICSKTLVSNNSVLKLSLRKATVKQLFFESSEQLVDKTQTCKE